MNGLLNLKLLFNFFLFIFLILFPISDFAISNMFVQKFAISQINKIIIFVIFVSFFYFILISFIKKKNLKLFFLFIFLTILNFNIFDKNFISIFLVLFFFCFLSFLSEKKIILILSSILAFNVLSFMLNQPNLNDKKIINDKKLLNEKINKKIEYNDNLLILIFDSFPGKISSSHLDYQPEFSTLNKKYKKSIISTNGIQTSYSLTNFLDLNYVIDDFKHVPLTFEKDKVAKILSGQNQSFKELKKLGYKINYINNNVHHNFICSKGIDKCISSKNIKNFNFKNLNFIINDLEIVFYKRTLISKFFNIEKFIFNKNALDIEDMFDITGDILSLQSKSNLIFSYFLEPHDPFHLDANCNKIERQEYNKKNYTEQLKCVEKKIIKLLNKLAVYENLDILALSDTGHFFGSSDYSMLDQVKDVTYLEKNNEFLNSILNPFFIFKINDPICRKKISETYSQVNILRNYINCKNAKIYKNELKHSVFLNIYPHYKKSLNGKVLRCASHICVDGYFRNIKY